MTFPLFDELIEQTTRRGGCPSISTLETADRKLYKFVEAFQAFRRDPTAERELIANDALDRLMDVMHGRANVAA